MRQTPHTRVLSVSNKGVEDLYQYAPSSDSARTKPLVFLFLLIGCHLTIYRLHVGVHSSYVSLIHRQGQCDV